MRQQQQIIEQPAEQRENGAAKPPVNAQSANRVLPAPAHKANGRIVLKIS